MRSIYYLSLIVFIAHSEVLILTDDTIEDSLKNNVFMLVDFYAPWCGHCKRLQPEYEEASILIGNVAVLAKVDATVETKARGMFDISGYPTILWFVRGKMIEEYEAGRTAEDIFKWVLGKVNIENDL